MRILLISHWYRPVKSPVRRMVRIAEFLAKNHDVTVITSLPSYPTGVLPTEYRKKLWNIKEENGVRVIRVWDLPTPNRGFIKRTLNHLVFLISSSVAIIFLKPFDLTIVSSPSFFSGLAGTLAARIAKGRFIFDVRDLWPDSAFELGYKVNPLVRKTLKTLERFYYTRAEKIFCATGEIRKTIIKMGFDQNNIITLVNTVDINTFKPFSVDRKKINFPEIDFIIIYVGSLTQVQNLSTVISAANILKSNKNIKFILVGEGEDKNNLISQTQKLKLSNIEFRDGQPTDKIVEIINGADLGLISLSTNKFFSDNALPTKTSEYLGCGKPIIACAGKNLKELIEKNQVGAVVAPGDSKELAKAILELSKNSKLVKKYSLNARKLAANEFSDRNFYKVLEENIKDLS